MVTLVEKLKRGGRFGTRRRGGNLNTQEKCQDFTSIQRRNLSLEKKKKIKSGGGGKLHYVLANY